MICVFIYLFNLNGRCKTTSVDRKFHANIYQHCLPACLPAPKRNLLLGGGSIHECGYGYTWMDGWMVSAIIIIIITILIFLTSQKGASCFALLCFVIFILR